MEPPPPSLFRTSGSTAFSIGLPTGSLYSNMSLGDYAGQLFQIEGGPELVILNRLVLGFNFGIGFVNVGTQLGNACQSDGGSCYGINFNLGAHAELLLLPGDSAIVPWVGLEVGVEDLVLNESVDSNSSDASFAGSQFELRAGLDVKARTAGGWGPFVAYRSGKYTSVSGSLNNGSQNTSDIQDPSGHGWLFIGLRGRL